MTPAPEALSQSQPLQTNCTSLERKYSRQDKPLDDPAAILAQDGRGNTSSLSKKPVIGGTGELEAVICANSILHLHAILS
jgi:hypothetical protein